jgi:hypothetical protein
MKRRRLTASRVAIAIVIVAAALVRLLDDGILRDVVFWTMLAVAGAGLVAIGVQEHRKRTPHRRQADHA